jgi:signal peptidase I
MTEILAKLLTYGLPFIVLFMGLVWIIDILFFAKGRRQKIADVDKKFNPHEKMSEAENKAYQAAKGEAAVEPGIVEISKSFFPVLCFVFVMRSFLFEPFQIPSGSMIPTLKIGDFILVNKFTYGIRMPILNTVVIPMNKPQRGEVMVFYPPHQPRVSFIKRVIGLPGDKISYTNNRLYINGKEIAQTELSTTFPEIGSECMGLRSQYIVTEELLTDKTHKMQKCEVPGGLSRDGHWTVPEGHYFMMGDNRDNSADSRAWGYVPEQNIVGKAILVWMHWDEFLSIPSFDTVGSIE